MKISQSVEFMTLKHMHKRELQKKDDEIDKYIGLYGSAIKKINYLEMQIEKLEHDISLIETKEVQRHKDRSLLLQAVDDKIFQQTVLEKKNIGYSRKAQMLWTIRRILSPSLFRFDQLQLGAPSERAVQTWKQNFKEEMGFVDNLINKTYSDDVEQDIVHCAKVLDLIKKGDRISLYSTDSLVDEHWFGKIRMHSQMNNTVDRAEQVITDQLIIDYIQTELDIELEPNRVRAHHTQEIQITRQLYISEIKELEDLAETMMQLIQHEYPNNEQVGQVELDE
ncbi:Conserved_hypothetical protein [Hexamita inflata]|uniref:Uncharacterized protein n=1 Tax=Hexamita inflata TaxID=28002 RepID=A0ABP1HLF2_9EUKA